MNDINFVETDTNTIKQNIIAGYEELTGISLSRAHPVRLFLEALASMIIWLLNQINFSAKMNMLAYATGDYLDHIGLLVGCNRLEASKATTTIKVTLSATRDSVVTVPAGTRVSSEDNVVFAIDTDLNIPAGQTAATVSASCEGAGEVGNGYIAGEISKIIDNVGYVASMVNITTTEGGADEEDDES